MEEMTHEVAEKIIQKMTKDTLSNLAEYVRYWYSYTERAGVNLTQEFCMNRVPEIEDKQVKLLTNQEKLIAIIHWLIGDFHPEKFDKRYLTPDQQLVFDNSILFLKMFMSINGDKINEAFNTPDKVPQIMGKHAGELTKSDLLVLLVNMEW